jgi:prevent-host-death family protein
MKSLTVTELKANFSDVLKRVRNGESFIITYGRNRRPVGEIVPIRVERKNKQADSS